MHSMGIGIVPSLVPQALVRSVLGAQVVSILMAMPELFVNSKKFLAHRGPNTRLYNSRKNPGNNLYTNAHTLVCQTKIRAII